MFQTTSFHADQTDLQTHSNIKSIESSQDAGPEYLGRTGHN